MSHKLPALIAADRLRALRRTGFIVERIAGWASVLPATSGFG